MKRIHLCTPILLLSLSLAAHAQTAPDTNTPAPSSDTGSTRGMQRMTPDQMANGLARRLSLTDDQKAKIQPILADRQQKLQDLQADNSGRGMQRMRKMKSIQDDTDKKLNAIFTPDQQKAYAKLEEERKEQMKERRQQRQSGQ